MQEAVFLPALPFGLVKEVFGEVRVAKDQPVFPRRLAGDARLHEGAEGGDAGAVAYHDDGGLRVVRQAEVRVGLNKHARRAVFGQALAEVARSRAAVALAVVFVVQHADGEMHFFAHFFRRRRYRVEARRQRAQERQQLFCRDGRGVAGDDGV